MKGQLDERAEVIVRWEGSTLAIVSFLEQEDEQAYLLYSIPTDAEPELLGALLLMAASELLPPELRVKALVMVETLREITATSSGTELPF